VASRFNPWRDNLLRRVLGFSPFELQDEVRRLQKLVEELRREHAREVETLRAALAERTPGAERPGEKVVRLPIRG
jgi:hypothetical protein